MRVCDDEAIDAEGDVNVLVRISAVAAIAPPQYDEESWSHTESKVTAGIRNAIHPSKEKRCICVTKHQGGADPDPDNWCGLKSQAALPKRAAVQPIRGDVIHVSSHCC